MVHCYSKKPVVGLCRKRLNQGFVKIQGRIRSILSASDHFQKLLSVPMRRFIFLCGKPSVSQFAGFRLVSGYMPGGGLQKQVFRGVYIRTDKALQEVLPLPFQPPRVPQQRTTASLRVSCRSPRHTVCRRRDSAATISPLQFYPRPLYAAFSAFYPPPAST